MKKSVLSIITVLIGVAFVVSCTQKNPHRLRRHLKKRRSEKLENRRPRSSRNSGTNAASPTFCSADRNATAPEPLRGMQISHARESAVPSSWLSEPRAHLPESERRSSGGMLSVAILALESA
ncbi:MAG: hypothetical protein DME54_02710 [Verrucomicrobia bacterium]|nr:MAG: hypothetical protein DME54_02710 [Verrucomicrobiota bacterium]